VREGGGGGRAQQSHRVAARLPVKPIPYIGLPWFPVLALFVLIAIPAAFLLGFTDTFILAYDTAAATPVPTQPNGAPVVTPATSPAPAPLGTTSQFLFGTSAPLLPVQAFLVARGALTMAVRRSLSSSSAHARRAHALARGGSSFSSLRLSSPRCSLFLRRTRCEKFLRRRASVSEGGRGREIATRCAHGTRA
jgi:hypothetical protein